MLDWLLDNLLDLDVEADIPPLFSDAADLDVEVDTPPSFGDIDPDSTDSSAEVVPGSYLESSTNIDPEEEYELPEGETVSGQNLQEDNNGNLYRNNEDYVDGKHPIPKTDVKNT